MNIPIVKRQQDMLKKFIIEHNISGEFIEIGCGEGHNLQILYNLGLCGKGIDKSKKAIIAANEIEGNVVLLYDLFDLKSEKTDLVVALFILEHIKNDFKALEKINELLKNNGYLIISVPAHLHKYSNQDRLAGYYRRYDRYEIESKLMMAGFSIEKIICFGYPISNIYTNVYNFMLQLQKKGEKLQTENTEMTGIEKEKAHIFAPFRLLSCIAFPILTLLVKIDSLFHNTDLGTHYIILAKKMRD